MSDRHVIKGRGKRRGQYLCWARRASTEKATEDGFVWLPEQRKACRWADPRYIWHTWATDRARLHNGYFVKLVAPPAIVERVDELRTYISNHAAGAAEKLACYWLSEDSGNNYCHDCIVKLADAEPAVEDAEDNDHDDDDDAIDGGFDIDHDSPPYCETCGATLSGHLTEYGVDQEIEALTGDCAPTFDDVEGWSKLDAALVNVSNDDPRWRKITFVVEAARKGEQEAAEAARALAATPGMTEARTGLVSLLAARAVQKASEPSYRLWDEIATYQALVLSSDDMARHVRRSFLALEKRLTKEARIFADCFGFRSYWSGGLFMIEGRDGAHHWPFVVQAEQYRLWNPPAFQEGRAYMMHSCPSGNPKWPHNRDANPYPKGSEERTQWDCGYIGSIKDRGGR